MAAINYSLAGVALSISVRHCPIADGAVSVAIQNYLVVDTCSCSVAIKMIASRTISVLSEMTL